MLDYLRNQLQLPVSDPVLIFAIVLFVILAAPALARRLRVPGIIGLILAGAVIGPHGFHLLDRDASIELFAAVGLLYIMFLAGLEVDLNDFKKNRYRSLVFGLLTFSIPMLLGIALSRALNFGWPTSILVASMFASHTLLAYPLVSRMGVARAESVGVTIGGTLITDTAALLALAVVAGGASGELTPVFWLRLLLTIGVVGAITVWAFPLLGRIFYKYVEDEVAHYTFALGAVFLSAFVAHVGGLEPIIGALLAGLALNRLIPHTSPLMNRIEFIGNALFIPFFLIGVGMLVDFRALFAGWDTLLLAAAMIVVAVASKWLAAFATQRIFRFSAADRGMIFGLSTARAAATLAVALVGFDLGILDARVLNGAVLLILATSILSSIAVERSARKLALQTESLPDSGGRQQKILTPIADPRTIGALISLSLMIKAPDNHDPIYALAVVRDDEEARQRVVATEKMLQGAARLASASGQQAKIITRIDLNAALGILRAANELAATDIVLGWNAAPSAAARLFGSVLDGVLARASQTVLVTRIVQPLNTVKRMATIIPENAESEAGFEHWLRSMMRLSRQLGRDISFYGPASGLNAIQGLLHSWRFRGQAHYHPMSSWQNLNDLLSTLGPDDLLVFVASREGGVSYQRHMETAPQHVIQNLHQSNVIILYPEQDRSADTWLEPGAPPPGVLLDSLEKLRAAGRWLRRHS
ncbi:MAG: cation:proton antiporter [Leptospirales bacterium]|nr:cation:proton antiporter [Leptospirales bacterium]